MEAGRDPVTRLRLSPLFDASFYAAGAAARGLALKGADPLEHYVRLGEAARIAPHPLFDPNYYAARSPDVVAAGVNLLHHYVENGGREGRDPHPLVDLKRLREQFPPDFTGDPLIAYLQSRRGELQPHALIDPAYLAAEQARIDPNDARPALLFYLTSDPDKVNPSADFDGRAYRRLYPEARGQNPLVHYARFGLARGLRAPGRNAALVHALADIEAAAALEPDIVKPSADPLDVPIMRGYDLARREFRLYRRLAKAAGAHTHAHVILTPWLKRGGADRAVVALARAILADDEAARVLIVCTRGDDLDALGWAPVTPRLAVACVADEIDEAHDTFAAFANFLRFCGCRHLHVVNSRFGWDLVERYGRILKRFMRLYGFVFCQDYDEAGRRAGYAWTRLHRAIDTLDAVVGDNARTFAEFAADHGFAAEDAAKAFALSLPVDDRLVGAASQAAANLAQGVRRRHRVLWAGRFTAQKALDVAAEVARLAPEWEIHAFGGDDAPAPLVSGGVYDDFADLPLAESSAFLHTARWEGLPNVLLEAGAAGLPVVARDIGGVGDLIDSSTGWPVPADAGPEAFAAALRALLAQPDEAMTRARRLSARIAERHSFAAFRAGVRRLTQGGAA